MSTETLEKPTEKVKSMFCEKVDRANVVVDEEHKNHISSSKPAYMHRYAMEKLEESKDTLEQQLRDGVVDPKALEFTKRKLKREAKRLDDIHEQTPVYTHSEMAHIKDARMRMEEEMKPLYFTKSDMNSNNPDPQVEADRMTMPCVKVDALLAKRCNVELTNGKCSRSQAELIRKMALWHETGGEAPAYTEELRTDSGGHVRKSSQVSVDIDLKAMEAKNAIIAELEKKMASLQAVVDEADKKIEEGVVEVAEVKTETYICPDCNKTVNIKGKGIHDARWCKVKNKKEE